MTLEGIPETVGPYRIEERLGAGGMGEVYRAYDQRLDRRVALKHIRPDRQENAKARERFLREAQVAARLNHPALVHVHDILEEGGLWIVMELAEGERLDHLLAKGPLPLETGLDLSRQIASGLAAIHAAGILHRDLKTQNVIITPAKTTESGEMSLPSRARILDFGLARADDQDSSLSTAGGLLGTPRAMSPEQARGEEISHLSDLFSLGTLLYETFTGRSPFLGPGTLETLGRICHHEPDPITELVPDLPVELARLIDQLLAKDPGARPQGAEEVVGALEQLMSLGEGSAARRFSIVEEFPEEESPHRPALPGAFRRHGERRQLTVLCCELARRSEAGSSQALDPESLYEVLPRFQALVDRTLRRFGGYLEDFQGHRLVVFFGYPNAFEDAGRRAVLTALAIVSGTKSLAGTKDDVDSGEELTSRVGIHTGPSVILTPENGREKIALGATLDLAFALQEAAGAGEVVVSPVARSLVEGLFVEESAGSLRLSRSAEPVPMIRIVEPLGVHSRVEGTDSLPPLVGRQKELDLLVDRFRVTCEGNGQAILITGEAGIGKTRLVMELKQRLSGQGAQWFAAHGSRFERKLEFFSAAGLLKQILEPELDQDEEPTSSHWIRSLAAFDIPEEEIEPVVASLLEFHSENEQALTLEEQVSAQEILPDLLLEIAEQSFRRKSSTAIVLVFENLQWTDSATLDLVGSLIGRCVAAPLLVLLTSRSGFQSFWGHCGHLTQIHLQALEEADSRTLVATLCEGAEVSPVILDSIFRRGGGVPWFVEELSRQAVGGKKAGSNEIPSRLVDYLSAELDRLGTAREVAQLAATLSPYFSHRDLFERWPFESEILEHEVKRLLEAGILSRDPSHALERLWFRHSLLRDLALASVLPEDRSE